MRSPEQIKKSINTRKDKMNRLIKESIELSLSTNGQPMNDKKCRNAYFKKHSILDERIEKLQKEIAYFEDKLSLSEARERRIKDPTSILPYKFLELMKEGIIIQWKKYPNTFFVDGVTKGRIIYRDGKVLNKYYSSIPTSDQKRKFKYIFYTIKGAVERK